MSEFTNSEHGPEDAATAFLECYWRDHECSRVRSFAEYLEIFGTSEAVARAFISVTSEGSTENTLGQYRLHEEIGRGAQGVVYRATNERTGGACALKLLKSHGNVLDDTRRFQREVAITAKLSHPHICPTIDAQIESGTPFVVMPLLKGQPLSRHIECHHDATVATRRDQEEWIRNSVILIEKVARAIQVAHDAGVIHRDIKPGNILVTESGDPMVMDFGLARSDVSQTITQTNAIVGTPAYMAPEQLDGVTGIASDTWALGATLYQLTTGKRPFDGATIERLQHAIQHEEPFDPRSLNSNISKDLRNVLGMALEKSPKRRHQSAGALADDLEAILEGRPPRARRVGLLGRTTRWARREPSLAVLIAVLLVALPTVAALYTAWSKDQPILERARRDRAIKTSRSQTAEGYRAMTRDVEFAASSFREALRNDVENRSARYGLALSLLLGKKPDQALDFIRGRADEHLGARIIETRALESLGKKSEAAAVRNTLPEPTNSDDYCVLAWDRQVEAFQLSDARNEAARASLDYVNRAILLAPRPRLDLYMLRAQFAGRVGQREMAHSAASALQTLWPDSATACDAAGAALFECGDYKSLVAATTALEQALTLQPDLTTARFNLGATNLRLGRIAEGIACFERVLEIDPKLALAHNEIGGAHVAAGNFEKALTAFTRAFELDPGLFDAKSGSGTALIHLGRTEEALVAFEKAIAIEPRFAMGHNNRGHALQLLGRTDEALKSFEDALRSDPTHNRAMTNMTNLLVELNRSDEAANALRRLAAQSPGSSTAHRALGFLACRQKRWTDAVDCFERAVEREAQDAASWRGLALAQAETKNMIKARRSALQAAALEPGVAENHRLLGTIMRAETDHESAIVSFRNAYRRAPDDKALINLVGAQAQTGDFRAARKNLENVRSLGAQPLAINPMTIVEEAGRDDERAKKLESGEVKLDDTPLKEVAELARVAYLEKKFELSARLYHHVRNTMNTMTPSHRERSIHAALAASLGNVAEADAPNELSDWFGWALKWLEADFDSLPNDDPEGLKEIRSRRRTLDRWGRMSAVAFKNKLAPEKHRAKWLELWTSIDEELRELRELEEDEL